MTQAGYSCGKATKERKDWAYLNALKQARMCLLNGYSQDEAIRNALIRHDLSQDDIDRLTDYITEKGAVL